MGFTQYPLFLLALLVTNFPHKKKIVLLSQIHMDVKKWVTQASRGTWKKNIKKNTCNAFTCLSILVESFVCEPLVWDLAGSPMDLKEKSYDLPERYRRIRRMVLGSQDESNPQVKYSDQTYEGLSWSGGIFQILGSQTLETRLQLRERLGTYQITNIPRYTPVVDPNPQNFLVPQNRGNLAIQTPEVQAFCERRGPNSVEKPCLRGQSKRRCSWMVQMF